MTNSVIIQVFEFLSFKALILLPILCCLFFTIADIIIISIYFSFLSIRTFYCFYSLFIHCTLLNATCTLLSFHFCLFLLDLFLLFTLFQHNFIPMSVLYDYKNNNIFSLCIDLTYKNVKAFINSDNSSTDREE